MRKVTISYPREYSWSDSHLSSTSITPLLSLESLPLFTMGLVRRVRPCFFVYLCVTYLVDGKDLHYDCIPSDYNGHLCWRLWLAKCFPDRAILAPRFYFVSRNSIQPISPREKFTEWSYQDPFFTANWSSFWTRERVWFEKYSIRI